MPIADASAPARPLFPAPTESLRTSLRYYAFSRVVLAALLFGIAVVGDLRRLMGIALDQGAFARVSGAWLALAVAFLFWNLRSPRRFYAQIFAQFFTDLVLLVALMHFAGGERSGIGVLLVAAVAAAAILVTPRIAALFAAAATLLLLAEALPGAFDGVGVDAGNLQLAAMVGTACFVTAFLVNRLAMGLAAQEALARERGEDLQRQLEATRLVMSEFPHGVVVVDERTGAHRLNRSARAILGDAAPEAGLARVLDATRADAADPQADRVVEIAPGDGARPRRLRVRSLRAEADARLRLLVLEDLREVEERASQLKLASMGRLSASIAHEIRNPLSAIRHANGLLAEQLSDPRQARLARIVEDNSVRIDRIVEDVLSVVRRDPPRLEPVDVRALVEDLVPQLAAVAGTDPRRIEAAIECDDPIEFAPDQLRQVLANLVGNALRYASASPGAVRMQWRRGADRRLELRVLDDGPGLPRELLAHVFEPFFTTEVRGTGLGLYLAREICEANRASLAYEPPDAGRESAFVMRPLARQASAGAGDGGGNP